MSEEMRRHFRAEVLRRAAVFADEGKIKASPESTIQNLGEGANDKTILINRYQLPGKGTILGLKQEQQEPHSHW